MATAFAIGFGQHHQVGKAGPVRHQFVQGNDLRRHGGDRPGEVGPLQAFAGLGFERFGLGMSLGQIVLQHHRGSAGKVEIRPGPIKPQAIDIQMRPRVTCNPGCVGKDMLQQVFVGDDGRNCPVFHGVHHVTRFHATFLRKKPEKRFDMGQAANVAPPVHGNLTWIKVFPDRSVQTGRDQNCAFWRRQRCRVRRDR